MNKNIVKYALLISLAFILSYIEFLIPLPLPIPGIKLGIANMVIVFCLATTGVKSAIFVSLIRVILFGFTFGNLSLMLYSLVGAIFSLIIMILLIKMKIFSLIGISMMGGAFHNIGQITVAIIILHSFNLIYYLPILLIIGMITGFFIGYATKEILIRIPNNILT